jgi:hypothetical protein
VTAAPRPRAVHYAWIVAAVTFDYTVAFWAAGALCLVAAALVFGLGRPASVPDGRRAPVEPLAVEV